MERPRAPKLNAMKKIKVLLLDVIAVLKYWRVWEIDELTAESMAKSYDDVR